MASKSKILCIYNPQAGGGNSMKNLSDIKNLFESYSLDVEFVFTEHDKHAFEIVSKLDLQNYSGLIVAGGDGSFFNVLNGYMSRQDRPDITFGILPVGTGNSLSRDVLDGDNDLSEYIKIIKTGNVKLFDIAKVKSEKETFYYANMMSFGFITDVVETASKLKMFKKMAYSIGVLYNTIKLNSFDLKMTIDGVEHNMDNVFVIISNSKYTGGNYLIAPHAKIDDGKLDLIILNKLRRIDLLNTFPKIFDGSHVNTKFVDYIQAKHIKLETKDPKNLAPDGEVYGELPVEITCMQGAIKMYS